MPYDTVKTWTGDSLKASSIDIVACGADGDVPLIGFDMCAEDDTVFAHGHYDLPSAKKFAHDLLAMIEEVEKGEVLPKH